MFEISCLVLFFILFISLNNFQNIAYVLTPFCFCSDVHNCILTLLQFYLLISFFFPRSLSLHIYIFYLYFILSMLCCTSFSLCLVTASTFLSLSLSLTPLCSTLLFLPAYLTTLFVTLCTSLSVLYI